MKTALLVGGFGALGYEVTKVFLENDYEVKIVDKPSIQKWNDNLEEEVEELPVQVVTLANGSLESDLIVFLAEQNNCSPSLELYLEAEYIESNIVLPQIVAHLLVMTKTKRMVLVGWDELFTERNIFSKTMKDRMIYPLYYNRGNNVISVIRLPRLIGPHHYTNTFGNIVKRVYIAISDRRYLYGIDQEIVAKTSWAFSNQAARNIYNQAIRRTREDIKSIGWSMSPLNIARFIARDMLNVSTEFRTPKKVYNLDKKVKPLPIEFQEEITRCMDVWDRRRDVKTTE